MVNKKGWLRIVEATVAIMLILTIILIVAERKKTTSENDISESVTPLLEEIARNATLRDNIMTKDSASVEAEIAKTLLIKIDNPDIGYDVRVCDYKQICALDSYPETAKGDIYSGERIISSALGSADIQPKKVVVFIWLKK
ncbi:MAG: hypothetical protein MUF61_00165 [archaeon]|jgi:hypothetical protein|nr:hypothetical protein [archaeon]